MWVKKHHICFLYIEVFFALKRQNEIKETTNKCTFVPFVTLILSFCEMISVNWYFEVRRLSRGVTKHHKHFRYIPLFFAYIAKTRYYDKKILKVVCIRVFFQSSLAYVFSLYFLGTPSHHPIQKNWASGQQKIFSGPQISKMPKIKRTPK